MFYVDEWVQLCDNYAASKNQELCMKTPAKKRFIHRILTSRGVLLLEVILIVIILIGITKEVVRRMSLRQEIATLEQQITELQAQNRSLGEYVASINTDSFREREARKRLNLQRPGETLLIVPEANGSSFVANTTSTTTPGTSNTQRWWHYFFSSNS
jgi:cell division protein FtsB